MRRLPVFLMLLLAAVPVAGQDGPTLIRQGRAAFLDFDNDRALPLLRRGLNPAAGPADELWALGAQSLTQILFDEGNPELVPLWARFAMRSAPDMPLDSVNVIAEVLDAFTAARAAVGATADDPLAPTRWVWPSGDPGAGMGRLQAAAPGVPGATTLVVGRGVLTGGVMSVPAGVYQVQVSAAGYRTVTVTREVLPGITTLIVFDMVAAQQVAAGTLAPETRDLAVGRTAGLVVTRFGRAETCGAGVFVGRDGLLLTTYRAIRGADRVEAVLGGRRITDGIQVAAYDVAADLAVLTLPLVRNDSMLLGAATAADYAWSIAPAGCAESAVTRTRIADRSGRAAGFMYLADSLASAPVGSPVVNETGALVGLWDAPGRIIPADRTRTVLAGAAQRVAGRQQLTFSTLGEAEHHLYGSMQVSSAVRGAVGHVTPLESYARWPELEVSSPLPMIYAAPAGRYRLVVSVDGEEPRTSEFIIQAGVADAMSVDLGPVAAVPPPPGQVETQRRGGGFPWLIAALGGVGAGVAAFVLLGGGESLPTRGSITLSIPNR